MGKEGVSGAGRGYYFKKISTKNDCLNDFKDSGNRGILILGRLGVSVRYKRTSHGILVINGGSGAIQAWFRGSI